MSFNRKIKHFSFILILVQLAASVRVAQAAPPDAATLQMLREIYTQLNESRELAQSGWFAGAAPPPVSVEDELKYFENNVQDVQSAQEFVRNLHSLSGLASTDFDPHLMLHPYLEEIRLRTLGFMNIPDLIRKEVPGPGGASMSVEEANRRGAVLGAMISGRMESFARFIIATSVASGIVLHGYLQNHCRSMCESAVLELPESQLLPSGGVFPGGAQVCQSYYGDHDASRYSDSPRFNYTAIDQQLGDSSCRYQIQCLYPLALVMLPATVYIACAATVGTVHAGKKVYSGVCQVAQSLRKFWSRATAESTPLLLLAAETLAKVETELGIRHIVPILDQVVGFRVLVAPCSNEFDHCPICLEDFKGFVGTVATACCHTKFDRDCLKGWFNRIMAEGQGPHCPHCRASLVE